MGKSQCGPTDPHAACRLADSIIATNGVVTAARELLIMTLRKELGTAQARDFESMEAVLHLGTLAKAADASHLSVVLQRLWRRSGGAAGTPLCGGGAGQRRLIGDFATSGSRSFHAHRSGLGAGARQRRP